MTLKPKKAYENTQALTPEDVTEAVWWVATLPKHVNINTLGDDAGESELCRTQRSPSGLTVSHSGLRAGYGRKRKKRVK
ncbi:hypothetical protein LNQ52_25865 [Klebsiella pneumoniae subsp. pneumoniae]|nr:hypothetical protein [Klebsiella pneumoniae subsp. pneumoniae]